MSAASPSASAARWRSTRSTFRSGAGEIHAFLGANGAGKSTLIRILARRACRPTTARSTGTAQPIDTGELSQRVAIVHQDLGPHRLHVGRREHGDGLRLSAPPQWPDRLDEPSTPKPSAVLAELGAPLPLHTAISLLSPAERSIVAIARAVSRDVELLILDEPTASLPEADVERLFACAAAR